MQLSASRVDALTLQDLGESTYVLVDSCAKLSQLIRVNLQSP